MGIEPTTVDMGNRCAANCATPGWTTRRESNPWMLTPWQGVVPPLHHAWLDPQPGDDPGYPPWQSGTLPLCYCELVPQVGLEPTSLSAAGFEPAAFAISPSGHWYARSDSNRDALRQRGLSPPCLPFHHERLEPIPRTRTRNPRLTRAVHHHCARSARVGSVVA